MKTFRAGFIADAALRAFGASIEQAAQRADPFLELTVLHASPEKVRAGMLVYADGADWNPGSGEGVYRRNKLNSAWVYLG